jgi:hypothetical protein
VVSVGAGSSVSNLGGGKNASSLVLHQILACCERIPKLEAEIAFRLHLLT